jgi:hypothetical protein
MDKYLDGLRPGLGYILKMACYAENAIVPISGGLLRRMDLALQRELPDRVVWSAARKSGLRQHTGRRLATEVLQ